MMQRRYHFWSWPGHDLVPDEKACMRPTRWSSVALAVLLALAAVTAGAALQTAAGHSPSEPLVLSQAAPRR
jgi:hypothetical protein